MGLSEQEKSRYHRQMIFPNWGEETQLRLKGSKVFVAGAGGLGRRQHFRHRRLQAIDRSLVQLQQQQQYGRHQPVRPERRYPGPS